MNNQVQRYGFFFFTPSIVATNADKKQLLGFNLPTGKLPDDINLAGHILMTAVSIAQIAEGVAPFGWKGVKYPM